MKFWKELIRTLDGIPAFIIEVGGRITDLLRSVNDNLKTISNNLTEDENFIANENPIKKVSNLASLVLHEDSLRNKLVIQNIGLEPCYIKLDSEVSKDDFHFVLAPDTSLAFGNGGSVILDNWHGEIYAICEKETKLSVLEY